MLFTLPLSAGGGTQFGTCGSHYLCLQGIGHSLGHVFHITSVCRGYDTVWEAWFSLLLSAGDRTQFGMLGSRYFCLQGIGQFGMFCSHLSAGDRTQFGMFCSHLSAGDRTQFGMFGSDYFCVQGIEHSLGCLVQITSVCRG